MNIQIKRTEDKEFTPFPIAPMAFNSNPPHPNFSKIIESLRGLDAKKDKSPWILAIIEYLPYENSHTLLVESLASQSKDDPKTMVKILGVEITELLLNRSIVIK